MCLKLDEFYPQFMAIVNQQTLGEPNFRKDIKTLLLIGYEIRVYEPTWLRTAESWATHFVGNTCWLTLLTNQYNEMRWGYSLRLIWFCLKKGHHQLQGWSSIFFRVVFGYNSFWDKPWLWNPSLGISKIGEYIFFHFFKNVYIYIYCI